MASNSSSLSYKPGEYFWRFQLQIMIESQPEGSELTRDAVEEDLIEESAFDRGRRNRPTYPESERGIIYKRQQTKSSGKPK